MSNANTYWDRHVSASNLPGDEALTPETWPEEIAFYLTPEQEFAHREMGPLPSRHIAEIGCGVGVHAIYLAREGAWVAAVDPSVQRLKVLKGVAARMGLNGRIHPICARAERLPFREGALDAAYTKASLIHTDLSAALGECRRVLRPGGRGVFCEPTASSNCSLVRYRCWTHSLLNISSFSSAIAGLLQDSSSQWIMFTGITAYYI